MINIETTEKYYLVTSPYNQDFTRAARQLGGRWIASSKQWRFDLRDKQLVQDAMMDIYGTDGSEEGELVTLKLVAGEDAIVSEECEALYLGPIQIARAYGRDSRVDLGKNVVIAKGKAFSGGSRRYWKTVLSEHAHIIVRDVPRGMAEQALKEAQGKYSSWASAAIVEKQVIDRQALVQEAERLRARLAEIEQLLATVEFASIPTGVKATVDADLLD